MFVNCFNSHMFHIYLFFLLLKLSQNVHCCVTTFQLLQTFTMLNKDSCFSFASHAPEYLASPGVN